MLFDLPVHNVAAGSSQLLQDSRNHAGHQQGSLAHLDCNLKLKRGGRHGLIGKNGCGKTTLLRAMASGSIEGWPQDIRTSLVEVGASTDSAAFTPLTRVLASDNQSTLREEAALLEEEARLYGEHMEKLDATMARLNEIYESLDDEDEARARAYQILRGLGFDQNMADSCFGDLSRGWQARCAIAAGLFAQPDLLLLDEPTTHLDLETMEWLEHYLKYSFKGTLLFVSHDRSFVNEVAEEIILFADCSLTYFRGTLTAFEKRCEAQSKNLERQVAALERKKEHVRDSIESMRMAELSAEFNRQANKADNKYAQYSLGGKANGDSKSRQIAQRQKKLDRMGLEKTLDGKKYKMQEMEGPRIGAANNNDGGWVDGKMPAAPIFIAEEPMQPFPFAYAGD